MVKGFDRPSVVCRSPFCFSGWQAKENEMKKQTTVKKQQQKDIIASRKRCKADGTGLSHYILMDRKSK